MNIQLMKDREQDMKELHKITITRTKNITTINITIKKPFILTHRILKNKNIKNNRIINKLH